MAFDYEVTGVMRSEYLRLKQIERALAAELSEAMIDRAATLMSEATDYFIQHDYGVEALKALIADGWSITPPWEQTIGGDDD